MATTLKIQPSRLQGTLKIPPSKSQTARALIFGAMAEGTTEIRNLLVSKDTLHMIDALQAFGAKFVLKKQDVLIEGIGGNLHGAEDVIQVGNSGIALRFFTALSALSSQPTIITGDPSIRSLRSMNESIEALRLLKVNITSTRGNGCPPLIVQGPVLGEETTVEGMDSQHVSALLILGMYLEKPLRIVVKNPGERPWVDLTLSWLDRFHTPYRREGYHFYEIHGKKKYPGFSYTVPADLSTALFPLAAAIITNSSLAIEGLDFSDPQGDKKAISIFQQMGANIEISEKEGILRTFPSSKLHGITIDMNDCIDAVTLVAALACFAEGKTEICNVKGARGKECDRISCISEELNKMGGKVTALEDGLIIEGSFLQGASLHSHNDHRMAMSLAIAGLGAQGTTHILHPECITKTYPHFIFDFQTLGANVE